MKGLEEFSAALAPAALELGAAFTPVHFQKQFLLHGTAGKTLQMQLGDSDWHMSCAQAELSAGISWRAPRILQAAAGTFPARGAPGWESSPAVGFSILPLLCG